MIPDPALRPPRRFALLAWALVLPSVLLAGVAGWVVRANRSAALAEIDLASGRMAHSVAGAITNWIAAAGPAVSHGFRTGAPLSDNSGPHLLITDDDGRLSWPIPGPWPPVPQPIEDGLPEVVQSAWAAARRPGDEGDWERGVVTLGSFIHGMGEVETSASVDRILAAARLLRAHALWKTGRTNQASEAFHEAFARTEVGVTTESGLSVREVAAHAILDLADGIPARLPVAWRSDPFVGVRELVGLASTPVAESAIARIRPLLPSLREWAKPLPRSGDNGLEWFFLQRDLVRRAHAAVESRRPGRNGREPRAGSRVSAWSDAYSFELDHEVWLALRFGMPGDGVEGVGELGQVPGGRRVFVLIKWADLAREAVERLREIEPSGLFGHSLRARAADVDVGEAEPAGFLENAPARVAMVLPNGLNLTVSVGLVRPDAYFSGVHRVERLMMVLVLGAVGVSVIAAAVTWRMLVRQHRLGVQKSNFVSSVSHELRAPLASVRLLADNLEQNRVSGPERRGQTLRLIGRECRRLGALVDNVLDLARMERHQKRIDPEPTDVVALVRETARLAGICGEEHRNVVRVEVGEEARGLVARVDGRALQQTLSNLLDNALKHSPAGGEVLVALSLRNGGREFELSVSDAGPGIPPEQRERVFEPFHRLGSELRRENPGVGIGLAIVRHLVDAHGGRVRVEAAGKSGARFVIEMPVGLDPLAPETR